MKYLPLKGFFASIASGFVGAALNVVVMWANGGYMPVHDYIGCVPGMVLDSRHVCAAPLDRLSLLSDRVLAFGAIFSFGDMLIIFGIALWAISFFFLVGEWIAEKYER